MSEINWYRSAANIEQLLQLQQLSHAADTLLIIIFFISCRLIYVVKVFFMQTATLCTNNDFQMRNKNYWIMLQ